MLNKIEKKYHGKNIVFVSISLDGKKYYEDWREMIKAREMGGVQLLADEGDYSSSFVRAYQINGIPRYILLDPEGKIVTANAPRPSDSDLIKLFDELGL